MPRTAPSPPASRAFASTRKARWAISASSAPNSTDTESNLPFLSTDRERFLEYDVTKLIVTLANQTKSGIGLISGIPIEGNPGMPMMGRPPSPPIVMLEHIREFFELKSIAKDAKEIPADIGVLMVVQPEGLSADTAYAIDQFALAGGKVLAFVDPVAETHRQGNPMMMMMQGPPDLSEFDKLLKAWGVAFDTQDRRRRHLARPARAVRQRAARQRHGVRAVARPRPPQPRRARCRSRAASSVSNFASAGFLEKAAGRDHAVRAHHPHHRGCHAGPRRKRQHDARRGGPAARLQARRQAAGAGGAHLRRCQERLPRRPPPPPAPDAESGSR